MNNKNLIFASLFFSIIFSIPIFAIDIPCAFFGTAKMGDNYVNGTLITAHLNETGEYLATADEIGGFGNYSIIIPNINNYIKFKIAGIWSKEPESLCISGKPIYLDLTAAPLPDGSSCEQDISCSSNYCVECNNQKICRSSRPFSGDGCCQTGENCDNSVDCPCPSGQICDAGTCLTPSGPILPAPCTENWTCTEWSSCVDGTQTRNCTDLNNCNTKNNKPISSQNCFVPPPCVEDWSCTDWSKCVNKLQNRTCTDLNNCGTLTSKPDETQKCKEEKPKQQELPAEPTGLFSGLNTFDLLTTSILGLVVLVILLFILKRRKPKRKTKRKSKRKR